MISVGKEELIVLFRDARALRRSFVVVFVLSRGSTVTVIIVGSSVWILPIESLVVRIIIAGVIWGIRSLVRPVVVAIIAVVRSVVVVERSSVITSVIVTVVISIVIITIFVILRRYGVEWSER